MGEPYPGAALGTPPVVCCDLVMPARTRSSVATRSALLGAARELFATEGYEGTTVRAVADRAGVNQALLFRYFGNKESLFAEAVTEQALALLSDGPPSTVVERTLVATLTDEPTGAMFLSVMRSGDAAAETLRVRLGAAYTDAVAAQVEGGDPADAALRAELMLAWLLGIAQLRASRASCAVRTADADTVIRHVLRGADALLGPTG